MDVDAQLRAPVAPSELFVWVDDLARYPDWMPLVHSVEALGDDAHGRPAWRVQIRGRLGPLARSKQLRMVRTRCEPHSRVTFERVELDGRSHSPWILDATLGAVDGVAATELTIHLHYGGALWTGGVLEKALADDIRRGRAALVGLVSAPPRR